MSIGITLKSEHSEGTFPPSDLTFNTYLYISPHAMTHFQPHDKHHILTSCELIGIPSTLQILLVERGITITEQSIRNWRRKWDGTAASLERKKGSGRKRLLSRRQVNNLILTPVRNKRRVHHVVHYSDLMRNIRQKFNHPIAERTIRNYGKRDLNIQVKHTNKRTPHECK